MSYTEPDSWSSGELMSADKLNNSVDNITYLAHRPQLLVSSNSSYTVGISYNVPLGMQGTITTEIEDARLLIMFNTMMTSTSNATVTIKIVLDNVEMGIRSFFVGISINAMPSFTYISPKLTAGAHTVKIEVFRTSGTMTCQIPTQTITQLFAMEI